MQYTSKRKPVICFLISCRSRNNITEAIEDTILDTINNAWNIVTCSCVFKALIIETYDIKKIESFVEWYRMGSSFLYSIVTLRTK